CVATKPGDESANGIAGDGTMARRAMVSVCLLGVALMAALPGRGQFPNQNIPPTAGPQTDEPPPAAPKRGGEKPAGARDALIGGVAPTRPSVPMRPVSPDPPAPIITIHVSAPASISAGADVEYKITVKNESQAAAHHVKVTNPYPDGARLHLADPIGD